MSQLPFYGTDDTQALRRDRAGFRPPRPCAEHRSQCRTTRRLEYRGKYVTECQIEERVELLNERGAGRDTWHQGPPEIREMRFGESPEVRTERYQHRRSPPTYFSEGTILSHSFP